jgi:hypothetical protein
MTQKTQMVMNKEFWDGTRWHGHDAFDTVSHIHVSDYSPEPEHGTCDIMAVECRDGRWYVEDNWGDGVAGAWNPFDANDEGPRFFDDEEAALRHACACVAAVSGGSVEQLLARYLDG